MVWINTPERVAPRRFQWIPDIRVRGSVRYRWERKHREYLVAWGELVTGRAPTAAAPTDDEGSADDATAGVWISVKDLQERLERLQTMQLQRLQRLHHEAMAEQRLQRLQRLHHEAMAKTGNTQGKDKGTRNKITNKGKTEGKNKGIPCFTVFPLVVTSTSCPLQSASSELQAFQ
jgi:hypothetical protein